MTIAQGINKRLAIRKQTGLGVIGSATAQYLRRETASFNLTKSTYENKEIATHKQATGVTHGLRQTSGTISGVLSPNTYSTLFASLTQKTFAAAVMTGMTGMTCTIASQGLGVFSLTVSGNFLTAALKIGDIIRITAGASIAAADLNKNLFVVDIISNTVAYVRVVNNPTSVTALTVVSGTAVTLSFVGKKTSVPTSGHNAQEYWAIEEWFNDISVSDYYTDTCVSSVDVGLPSEGNATVAWNFAGLQKATSGSQVLTGATAETSTPIMNAVSGFLLVGGSVIANVTGASIKIDCAAANMGAVVGSSISPDVQRGRLAVSGQLTAFFQNSTFSGIFDAGTVTSLYLVVTDNADKDAEFVSFIINNLKFNGDTKDDGEKGLVQTIPFIAEFVANGSGFIDSSIIQIQDSLAA